MNGSANTNDPLASQIASISANIAAAIVQMHNQEDNEDDEEFDEYDEDTENENAEEIRISNDDRFNQQTLRAPQPSGMRNEQTPQNYIQPYSPSTKLSPAFPHRPELAILQEHRIHLPVDGPSYSELSTDPGRKGKRKASSDERWGAQKKRK